MPVRLTNTTLIREGTRLVATARLDGQLQGDYLSVVWLRGDHEVGRDSVYLDQKQRQARFVLPNADPGDYRVMLLFSGTLLRQLDWLDK